uniref:Uncharacterized protein n=1 Tax=Arundo donax TaxID=35708 RepID=A0A0A9CLB4_ARUDO
MAQNLNIPLQGMINASSDSNGPSTVLSFQKRRLCHGSIPSLP